MSKTAYSIHLGLNKVDPKHYGGDAALEGCHNDAKAMQSLAVAQGFKPLGTLLDKNATVDRFKELMTEAATTLVKGDALLITFSGHGSQFKDANSEEGDGQDETWCLFDRMILDDEIYQLICKFRAGVRITVFVDACNSGTSVRRLPFGKKTRHLPKSNQDYVEKKFYAYYEKLQASFKAKVTWNVKASLILLSGCQDDQESIDLPENGLFTGSLLSVWKNGSFKGTLKDLLRETVILVAKNAGNHKQIPNYLSLGAIDTTFQNAPALRP